VEGEGETTVERHKERKVLRKDWKRWEEMRTRKDGVAVQEQIAVQEQVSSRQRAQLHPAAPPMVASNTNLDAKAHDVLKITCVICS
jgi:hypothetical protein